MIRWICAIFVSLCFALCARSEERYALLIGNEDYPAEVGRLKEPHEDVQRIAAALEKSGFRKANITILTDASQIETNLAVASFASRLRAGGSDAVGFFYYSGHGGSAEANNVRQNYLIPAKTPITGAEQLPILGVSVNNVIDSLASANAKAVFIVSDACRNTLPFTSTKGGNEDKGMVRVNVRSGLYIAFATADGATAPDDGAFSSALAEQIVREGQTADRAFTLALRKVAGQRTGNRLPFSVDGLRGDICFAGCERPVPPSVLPGDEAVALGHALSSGGTDLLEAFLAKFPSSRNRKLVEQQLAAMRPVVVETAAAAPPPRALTAEPARITNQAGINSAKLALTLSGHESNVYQASLSPDGRWIVTESSSKSGRPNVKLLKIWDAESGQLVSTLSDPSPNFQLKSFSSDAKRILTAEGIGRLRIWDVDSGAPIAALVGSKYSFRFATFSPDGKRVAAQGDENSATIWNADTGEVMRVLQGHTGYVTSIAFSPDETRIATASIDDTLKIWDVSSGTLLLTLAGHSNAVNFAAFSPDGSQILSYSEDKTAKVWNARTGKLISTLRGHAEGLTSAVFSADGSKIVTSSYDTTAKIWDTSSGQLLQTLTGHTLGVESAMFSPDGLRVLTTSADDTLRVWSVGDGACLSTLYAYEPGSRNSLRSVSIKGVNADWTKMVTTHASNTVKVWNLAN